jgi:hypothetical protein
MNGIMYDELVAEPKPVIVAWDSASDTSLGTIEKSCEKNFFSPNFYKGFSCL